MRMIFVPAADRPECAAALARSFARARELDGTVTEFMLYRASIPVLMLHG